MSPLTINSIKTLKLAAPQYATNVSTDDSSNPSAYQQPNQSQAVEVTYNGWDSFKKSVSSFLKDAWPWLLGILGLGIIGAAISSVHEGSEATTNRISRADFKAAKREVLKDFLTQNVGAGSKWDLTEQEITNLINTNNYYIQSELLANAPRGKQNDISGYKEALQAHLESNFTDRIGENLRDYAKPSDNKFADSLKRSLEQLQESLRSK